MIAVHAGYFEDNFGDLLLVKIFEKWVNSVSDEEIVYPMVPRSEQPRFSAHFPNAKFGWRDLKEWSALIYAGGGLFGSSEINPDHFRWLKTFFRRNVLPAELCLWRKIPYSILGVEVGPIGLGISQCAAKRILRNAKAVSVRNLESREYLANVLKVCPQADNIPDPVLTVSASDIPENTMENIRKIFKPYQNRVLLGIHHPYRFLNDSTEAKILRERLVENIKKAPDVVPVVFIDSNRSGRGSSVSRQLADKIEQATGRECLAFGFLGIWETVALISQLSAVLTTKLHVGITAYALGVYAESFATHTKTLRFYRQIERPQQSSLIQHLTQEIVDEKLSRAISFACQKKSVIDERWKAVKAEAARNQKLLGDFLNSYSNKKKSLAAIG